MGRWNFIYRLIIKANCPTKYYHMFRRFPLCEALLFICLLPHICLPIMEKNMAYSGGKYFLETKEMLVGEQLLNICNSVKQFRLFWTRLRFVFATTPGQQEGGHFLCVARVSRNRATDRNTE